jgi:type II secretory pathway pseudopilin PulG
MEPAPECTYRGHSAFPNSTGFTYIALLAAIIIIGISMGAAGKYWQNVVQREKEEELLFRGDQYRLAIERYYSAIPGRLQYPASLDDLLKDERTPTGKRYLRQKYKDPMTGEDFVEIRDQVSRRISGVRSASDKTPLKQANFPELYPEFAGKTKYSDWKFVPVLQPAQPALPARPTAPVKQQ